MPQSRAVLERSLAQRARAREITGVELGRALAEEVDLTGADLEGANLDEADLSGLHLFKARLRGASLRNARLQGCELTGADLEDSDLEGADVRGAGLGMANLRGCHAFKADFSDATLTGADLTEASLACATLARTRLREADLTAADFRSADLREAELSLCSVGRATFNDADLRGARLRAVSDFESARWDGVDIRDINFAGAYRLRRFIVDENYLREFRESGRLQYVLYQIWWLTSDCGRSLGRWSVNIFVVAAGFAALFAAAGLQLGIHEPGAVTYLYYSVVTLTTLGYGDIVPYTATGKVLAIVEAGVGYLMLGGLISILANKMARRGE